MRSRLLLLVVLGAAIVAPTRGVAALAAPSAPAVRDTIPAAGRGYTGIKLGVRGAGQIVGNTVVPNGDPQVFVQSVDSGSPAHRAGLARGDVILEVDGRSIREGGRVLGNPEPGISYVLRIRRGDEEQEVTVTAIPAPANAAGGARPG